jgi:NADPH2:quinone reductase
LRKDEHVLITGAGGGMGSIAIQVAKRLGAIVIAAASSDEKLAIAKSLGVC